MTCQHFQLRCFLKSHQTFLRFDSSHNRNRWVESVHLTLHQQTIRFVNGLSNFRLVWIRQRRAVHRMEEGKLTWNQRKEAFPDYLNFVDQVRRSWYVPVWRKENCTINKQFIIREASCDLFLSHTCEVTEVCEGLVLRMDSEPASSSPTTKRADLELSSPWIGIYVGGFVAMNHSGIHGILSPRGISTILESAHILLNPVACPHQ